jgi:starch synthase (maltosyl-transferring)
MSVLETPIDPELARAMKPSERISVASVRPSAEGGSHVKRIEGDVLRIEADIVCDGHGLLAVAALVRSEGSLEWTRVPMHALGNDRYAGECKLVERGIYDFLVEVWLDVYGGFARDLEKKRIAGVDITNDLEEGRSLIGAARGHSPGPLRLALDAVLHGLEALSKEECARLLSARETVSAMAAADQHPFLTRSEIVRVEAERKRALFSSWYELFPRSQNGGLGGHGSLQDVIAELPRIAAMGFDVLYMPPIHPIGTTNRKGKNNSLTATSEDPGSPYAIGAAEGGHDAIHPELGSYDDLHALVDAAREHDIEIAIDFAVQCSPDHPWLKAHPGWFDWRADGTIKFAENPPKKYEDIVNVDFYAPDAMPGLWLALRDVVLFWIGHGVKTFRVDNPHTKPFPFWRWLIADIRTRHPEVIFLSEAFTQPKRMYELAKLGFNQSYTYFTWRNTKAELTEYLTELNTPPVSDIFRPNFFVNTPDINPVFLQSGARAAFLIRAALAATLAGSWGMYSGFELCEHDPLPGREEYKDSEKYEIKARDWAAQGNIEGEIAALNAVRRREPALQTHLGITFHNAFNDSVLCFEKHVAGANERILVMVSLDPFNVQDCDFEIPLWQWNLPDSGSLAVEDLLYGYRFVWSGKIQHIRLEPSAPYRIWRLQPTGPRPA